MALQLIGAGFGRTGTVTLKAALEMLGLGPCHHMLEVMDNAETQLPFWNRVAEDSAGADWDEVYGGYKATVDWPGCHFYRELTAFYPDAKVILSLRDAGEWYDSMAQTILAGMAQMDLDRPVPKDNPMYFGAVIIGQKDLGGDLTRENVIAAFERHNDEVRRAIPASRLLEYRVTEGWEPLCRFLDLPIPPAPFPRTNARDNFQDHIETARGVADANESKPSG